MDVPDEQSTNEGPAETEAPSSQATPPAPATQRVPARTRAPLAVALVVVGIIGLLVVRPWDAPAPSPTPLVAVAPSPDGPPAASEIPGLPTEPASTDTGQPPIEPAILPTPDFGEPVAAGDYSVAAVADGPLAQCNYGRRSRGMRHLAAMEVQPPIVFVENQRDDVRDVRNLGWRFELQRNLQQTVFSSDWYTVARSRMQLAAAVDGQPANFTPLSITYDAAVDDRNAVYRARVVVEWYTRNVELAGRAELIPNRYREANDELGREWPVYCSGVRLA